MATNQYEAMFLVGPLAATEPEAGISLCRKFIESHGGQIQVIKKWDERKLSYEISGQKRGTYVIAFFKAEGAAVGAIERDVKLSEEILRVMILRADHINETEMAAVEPQPIQPREERTFDRWGGGGFGGGGGGGFGGGGGYGGGGGGGGYGDRGGDRGGDRPARPRREEGAPEGAPVEQA